MSDEIKPRLRDGITVRLRFFANALDDLSLPFDHPRSGPWARDGFHLLNDAADEIERLRQELDGARLAYRGASYDRDRMRSERDEARRWVCQLLASPESVMHLAKPENGTKRDFAAEQGWDCFKEANDGK